MFKKQKNIIFSALIFSFLFLSRVLVFAANDQCLAPTNNLRLQTVWPKTPVGGNSLSPTSTIPELIRYFFEWGIGLAGMAVFIALIIAGVEYITSISDPSKTKDARNRITSAVIGLVLLLGSWAIFNVINPSLNTLTDFANKQKFQNDAIKFFDKKCMGTGHKASECCMMFNPDCDTSVCPLTNCCATAATGSTCDPNSCPRDTSSSACPACQITNPGCNIQYWACCKENDKNCIIDGAELSLSGPGGTCENNSWCQSGLFCSKTGGAFVNGICRAGTGGPGSSCVYNINCGSGYCKGSLCTTKLANGEKCSSDSDCIEGLCKCNDGLRTDPVSQKAVWQKECYANPNICTLIFEKPRVGCDVVRFYDGPQFSGTFVDFQDPSASYNFGGPGGNSNFALNGNWVFWATASLAAPITEAQSFQAFVFQRDGQNNLVLDNSVTPPQPILMPCGVSACGCMIDRCLSGASSGSCPNDQHTADKNTGSLSELAYNSSTSIQYGVRVEDETKKSKLQKASGGLNWLSGTVKGLLGW